MSYDHSFLIRKKSIMWGCVPCIFIFKLWILKKGFWKIDPSLTSNLFHALESLHQHCTHHLERTSYWESVDFISTSNGVSVGGMLDAKTYLCCHQHPNTLLYCSLQKGLTFILLTEHKKGKYGVQLKPSAFGIPSTEQRSVGSKPDQTFTSSPTVL